MSKFFKKSKRLFGLILLILALGFFAFWELIGRAEFLYAEVVVLKEEVLKGTEISIDMLEYIKIDSQRIIDNCIMNPNDIIALEAKHFIPAGTQLVSNYFDISSLVLMNDEKIMKLPNTWIHSFPETLRRKDEVFIYAIKNSNENSNSSSESTDAIKSSNKRLNSNKDTEDKKIYIMKSTVAYVKDNSNKEVSSLDDDRLNASSVISNIEIVISEEQFETLRDYVQDGYTFILMYIK